MSMPMPMPLEENFNHSTTSGINIIKEDGVMDKESASIPTVVPSMNKNGEVNNNNDNKEGEKKKKKRPLGFFRAALLLLRSDSKSKKKSPPSPKVVDHANKIHSNRKWEKMVGSMRPLHLQDNRSIPQASPPPGVESLELEDLNYNNSSAMMRFQQHQPSSPSPSTVSSGGTMSQYASASNLQELEQDYHQGNDDDDPDEVFDALCGDEMIDAKAEEFIAQFYQQMKLQQIN